MTLLSLYSNLIRLRLTSGATFSTTKKNTVPSDVRRPRLVVLYEFELRQGMLATFPRDSPKCSAKTYTEFNLAI